MCLPTAGPIMLLWFRWGVINNHNSESGEYHRLLLRLPVGGSIIPTRAHGFDLKGRVLCPIFYELGWKWYKAGKHGHESVGIMKAFCPLHFKFTLTCYMSDLKKNGMSVVLAGFVIVVSINFVYPTHVNYEYVRNFRTTSRQRKKCILAQNIPNNFYNKKFPILCFVNNSIFTVGCLLYKCAFLSVPFSKPVPLYVGEALSLKVAENWWWQNQNCY